MILKDGTILDEYGCEIPTHKEKESTERLIGKDFGIYGYEKPTHWKSLVTGELYDYKKYINIEEQKFNWIPLPKEGYPYTSVVIIENMTK
jgi:hypothetical protein